MKIWDQLQLMAKDQTMIHENNKDSPGDFQHIHGWGIVYKIGQKIHKYYSDQPIFEDEIEQLLEDLILSQVIIIHARKASPDIPVGFDYLHPFVRKANDIGKIANSICA